MNYRPPLPLVVPPPPPLPSPPLLPGQPASFRCALLAVLTNDRFDNGVRTIISAGGCNCSRAVFAGALLGALHAGDPEADVPAPWVAKTAHAGEAQAAGARLCGE
jgi:hypothetical protein